MTQTIFKVASDELHITPEDILAAMKKYDETHRNADSDSGRKFAAVYNRKLYPPKRILSLAIKKSVRSFSGGEGKTGANQVFHNLGFEVIAIDNNVSTSSVRLKLNCDQSKINDPIPDVDDLITELFSKKWANLHANFSNFEDGSCPGVYLLAYSDKDLEGKPIKEEDIFYVGMTHAGIYKRLNQFVKGIKDNKHHSGARGFYKKYAYEVPYSKLLNKKIFFVAFVAIPCIVDKNKRTPRDLRKMGEVTRLELYVMAYIKEKLQCEPELNKK